MLVQPETKTSEDYKQKLLVGRICELLFSVKNVKFVMCMGANTAKFYLGVNKGLSSKMGRTHFEKNKSLPNGSFLR